MTATHKTLVEICVDSLASAVAAERGGADRIELCIDLPEGGITPPLELIREVRAAVQIRLQILIRPRAGNFAYTKSEFAVMASEIVRCKALGPDGIAIGVLSPDNSIDVARTSELVELAKPLDVTFHRAFELAAAASGDARALEDVIRTGCNRILTSGVARATCSDPAKAIDGAASLHALIAAANGRIAILAGGGIRENNVAEIIRLTGAREVHSSLNSTISSDLEARGSHNFRTAHHSAAQLAEPPSVVQAFQVRAFVAAAQI